MITYCQRDYVNFFFFCPLAVCVSALLLYALKKKKKKKRKKKKKGSVLLLSYSVRLYKSLVMCIFFSTGGTCL